MAENLDTTTRVYNLTRHIWAFIRKSAVVWHEYCPRLFFFNSYLSSGFPWMLVVRTWRSELQRNHWLVLFFLYHSRKRLSPRLEFYIEPLWHKKSTWNPSGFHNLSLPACRALFIYHGTITGEKSWTKATLHKLPKQSCKKLLGRPSWGTAEGGGLGSPWHNTLLPSPYV